MSEFKSYSQTNYPTFFLLVCASSWLKEESTLIIHVLFNDVISTNACCWVL